MKKYLSLFLLIAMVSFGASFVGVRDAEAAKAAKKSIHYKSAKTRRFVKKSYSKSHPAKTYKSRR